MLVAFKNDVMADENAFKELGRIFGYFEEDRHKWDTHNDDEIENSRWYKDNPSLHSFYEKAFTASSRPGSSMRHSLRLEVSAQSTSRAEQTPMEARKYLNEKTLFAVENATNDGAFLDTLLFCLGRRELLDAHTESWWEYDHLGGRDEASKAIERYLARSDGPIRYCVILDSDRLCQSEPYNGQLQAIVDECIQKKIPYHILEKRKIENYIPDEVLAEAAHAPNSRHTRRRLRAFARLTPEQRDFFELKGGFTANPTPPATSVPSPQLALFADLGPEQVQALCGGFGRKTADCFKDKRPLFTKENLKRQCHGSLQEFEDLFDKLESLL